MKIFIDQTTWIQLLTPSSPLREEITREFRRALNDGDRLFTHNVAVGIALNEITTQAGASTATKFNEIIEEAHSGAYLNILWITRKTQKEAVKLLRKYPHLGLDLYDFAVYLLSKRRKISAVMSSKQGFKEFGFKILPELGE